MTPPWEGTRPPPGWKGGCAKCRTQASLPQTPQVGGKGMECGWDQPPSETVHNGNMRPVAREGGQLEGGQGEGGTEGESRHHGTEGGSRHHGTEGGPPGSQSSGHHHHTQHWTPNLRHLPHASTTNLRLSGSPSGSSTSGMLGSV